MNKAFKIAIPIAGSLFAACAATAFLIAPGHADESQKKPFLFRNFAHRGLHTPDKVVPENSLTAFRLAAEKGYGVELDVHITRDDKLCVFHDDTTDRVCGLPGRVEDRTWDELSQLRLCGTQERIPLLREALEVIDGRGPVIIELKRGAKNALMCQLVLEEIDSYFGPVCIESFDPRIVRWFKKHAPDVLRGQLTNSPKSLGGGASPMQRLALGNLLTNFLARPHFIAHGTGKKTPLCRLCEALGALRFTWTSHSVSHEADSDGVIFEYYSPAVKYR